MLLNRLILRESTAECNRVYDCYVLYCSLQRTSKVSQFVHRRYILHISICVSRSFTWGGFDLEPCDSQTISGYKMPKAKPWELWSWKIDFKQHHIADLRQNYFYCFFYTSHFNRMLSSSYPTFQVPNIIIPSYIVFQRILSRQSATLIGHP